MEKEQIFKFINDNPVFALGTCAGGQPHVRYMQLFSADENSILFNTSRSRKLHLELQDNPLVEMCFYNKLQSIQIRIQGMGVLVNDTSIKTQVAEKIPVLTASLLQEGRDTLEIYQLINGRANIWSIDQQFDAARLTDREMSSVWMAVYPGDEHLKAHRVRK